MRDRVCERYDHFLFFYFYLFFINLFIYFWLCWVSVAVHGLSLVAVASLVAEHRL